MSSDTTALIDRDEARLRQLETSALASRVERAVGADGVAVDNWQFERIASGSREHAGTAHYRVTVAATGSNGHGSDTVDCSFVVKVHRKDPNDGALIPADARREVGVYRSNLPSQCPPVFEPVACHDVVEQSDSWWFWLSDLGDGFESTWTLDQYERAAGHLGQFNARFVDAGDRPDAEWAQPYTFDFDRVAPVVALLDEHPTDPKVERAFPVPVRERVLALWEHREALLARHESLPRTLCHFDGFPGNLVLEPGGEERTVAIDWELCGVGPVGADAAALTYVSAIWQALDRGAIPDLDNRVPAAYLAGLERAGWEGDPDAVRAGYTIHLVLRWLESIGHTRRTLFDGHDRPGVVAADFTDWMLSLNRALCDRVDEALALV
jgi:hypothetical protein